MKPIKEPLDPEEDAEPGGWTPRDGADPLAPAAIGLGLILLSVLGFVLSRGGPSADPGTGPAADAATASVSTAASAATASSASTALAALPESGGFGFTAYSSLPAPASPVVGAVQLAYFDGFLYAAATSADGHLRVASVRPAPARRARTGRSCPA